MTQLMGWTLNLLRVKVEDNQDEKVFDVEMKEATFNKNEA